MLKKLFFRTELMVLVFLLVLGVFGGVWVMVERIVGGPSVRAQSKMLSTGAATTVNGQACAIGGSCTVTANATSVNGASVPASQTVVGTNGSGQIVAGPSPGLVLVEQHTASGSASLNFTTCISSTYDEYLFEMVNLFPASDNATLLFRVSIDGGSSYVNGANTYNWLNAGASNGLPAITSSNGTTQLQLSPASDTSGTAAWSQNGWLRLFNPAGTSTFRSAIGQTMYYDHTNGTISSVQVAGNYRSSASAVNAAQFLYGTANIASGTVRCYGVAK